MHLQRNTEGKQTQTHTGERVGGGEERHHIKLQNSKGRSQTVLSHTCRDRARRLHSVPLVLIILTQESSRSRSDPTGQPTPPAVEQNETALQRLI
ncbi:hypothetical protein NQZ68_030140 [Dissostichus eleginoides]|nr:hypothetical protein NQZ68_030140 [Dissostichus eleginoides]